MTAHNHIVLHANTQSCSNACQHTITLFFLHTNTQSCSTACQHTVILYCIPRHNHAVRHGITQSHCIACQHTISPNACHHTITLYCMPTYNHPLMHANTQSHCIACQLTITDSPILTKKMFFIKSRIPAPCLCMQADYNTLELITLTKAMIRKTLSYYSTDTPELFDNKACLDSITCSQPSRYAMKTTAVKQPCLCIQSLILHSIMYPYF